MRDELIYQLKEIKDEAENGGFFLSVNFDGEEFQFSKVKDFFEGEGFKVEGWEQKEFGKDFRLNISWGKEED